MNKTTNTDVIVAHLRTDVEASYGSPMKTSRDFEQLSQAISDSEHEQVSATTLKRMWGYINEPVTPRMSTLDILAQFVGYRDFDDYSQQFTQPLDPEPHKARHRLIVLAIATVVVLAVIAVTAIMVHHHQQAEALPGVAVDKVIKRGDHFNSYDDYLSLFGIQANSYQWGQPVPGVKGVFVWGPGYQNPEWHNEVDTAKGCPTICEYWTPTPATRKPYMTPEYVALTNKYQFYNALNENAVRITFMKDFKHRPGFTFLGIYRLDPQRSTELYLIFELVDTTCVLADLPKFPGYAALINR